MNATPFDQLDPQALGQQLKLAREARGYTQAEAADFIQVGRTTLTAIEKGERRLKIEELITLAQAYGRSVGDFTRPRPCVHPFRIQYRGQNNPAIQEELNSAQTQFYELCRDYVELETILKAPLPSQYPPPYNITKLKADLAAETVAHQERKRLGLGDGPLPILRPLLEQDVGLRIFYLPLNDANFSEMYHYDELLGACLAVNQNHPEERRRWSLAHGYAHFLVHRYAPMAYIESDYEREQFADHFAKHFLMPTPGLLRHYHNLLQSKGKPTTGDLCVLAHYYGVSVSALVRRLEDLGIAPRGTWERLRERGFKVREAQQYLGLAPLPEQAQLLPVRYQYLAVEAYQQGEISEGLLAKFLRVDRLEARHIAQILTSHPSDIQDEVLVDLELELVLDEVAA